MRYPHEWTHHGWTRRLARRARAALELSPWGARQPWRPDGATATAERAAPQDVTRRDPWARRRRRRERQAA